MCFNHLIICLCYNSCIVNVSVVMVNNSTWYIHVTVNIVYCRNKFINAGIVITDAFITMLLLYVIIIGLII